MDVVYLCRHGDNEELRYSLRSLVNLPHDRVWIFGGAPKWVRGVTLVPTLRRTSKYKTTTGSLREACLRHGVSDPFILMNDDFYITEPAELGHYNRGPVRDVLNDYTGRGIDSAYTRGMRDTLDRLEAHGYTDPLSYELHVPLIVHKAPMLEALTLGRGIGVLHKRTAYGAVAGLTSTTVEDVKIRTPSDQIPRGPFLSTLDDTFPQAQAYLEGLFPDPGEYEPQE